MVVFKLQEINIRTSSLQKASETFDERNKIFNSYIESTQLKLTSIKNSKTFTQYLSNTKNRTSIESLFIDIANTSKNIMQLRYIDSSGVEKIRIDRESYISKAFLVKEQELQDKSNRYYFKESINSDEGLFWHSKLDLNVEHGKIEKPIKPVLRIATPIYFEGKKSGILIINIFMKHFLKDLTKIPIYNIYLFDNEGNILVDSVHKHCWSKYLETNATISSHFKDEYIDILSKNEYFGKNIYSNRLSLDNGENIHMIIEPKKDYIKNELIDILYELVWIMLAVVLLSFPFSYLFSRIPSKLKAQVDKQKYEQDILLSLFDLSDASLVKWNNDEKWSINFVSKSISKLLGYSYEDLKNNKITYASIIHKDDLNHVTEEVTKAIEEQVYFFKHNPYRVITKDGTTKWILDSTVIVRDKNNEIINFVGYLTDISELKIKEIELENISKTDQLTKISNRMHLDDILQDQYHRFYRNNELCSIVLIDIDYFKLVNDQYGHLIGDSVLIEFASILKSSLRAEDIVGRWGGEEFLIILPHTNLEQAMQLAEKLRVTISNHIFTTVKHKTASFGVATFEQGITIQTLLDTADSALYQSKNSGRNCITSSQEVIDD